MLKKYIKKLKKYYRKQSALSCNYPNFKNFARQCK